jgi:hypothetical protein
VTTDRLAQRVVRDFPEPGSADGVLRLLAGLPRRVGYDGEVLASERVHVAVVVLAGGGFGRLCPVLDLAVSNRQDLLVAAGAARPIRAAR